MFVDKKFIFISLPRCASTSFMITCLKNKISIEHFNSEYDNQLIKINDWEKMNNEKFADSLTHAHEPLHLLQRKFGNNNQIISIRRNKYDRFLSLWKHIIDELHRSKKIDIANTFSKLTIDDIFDKIVPNDIYNVESRFKIIDKFFTKFKIPKEERYTKNMLNTLFTPMVELTNNDDKIIWFDVNNLSELEIWVSKKLNMNFKMEKINSSKDFDSVIEINNDFKEKYDNLYKEFDERKLIKTLV
jgi:hypothetical protein